VHLCTAAQLKQIRYVTFSIDVTLGDGDWWALGSGGLTELAVAAQFKQQSTTNSMSCNHFTVAAEPAGPAVAKVVWSKPR
jgi:hypothetical protein